jgi:hypothetical protein
MTTRLPLLALLFAASLAGDRLTDALAARITGLEKTS